MLMRGTRELTYEQLEDRLSELRSQVGASGTTGLVSLSAETTRNNLPELLKLLVEILRFPRFDADDFEVLRRKAVSSTQARMSDPNSLAGLAVRRTLAPFPESDIRYVPTLQERIERYQALKIDQLRELHQGNLSSQVGEVVAVGDFDPEQLGQTLDQLMQDWTSQVTQARIAQPAQTQVPGGQQEILTPDKANAVRDDSPDYPALLVGNFILGGGALSSRLGDRVRQQEGLSYTVGSGLNAHPIDQRANVSIFAITNPENKDALVKVIAQELELLRQSGITEAELTAAKQGLLQGEQLSRSNDGNLVALLASTLFANRDLKYHHQMEQQIAELTVQQVNAAIKLHLQPERLVIVTAGDFKN
jgi:zinc protease